MMLKEIDVKNQLVIVMKSKVDKAKEEYEKSISKNMSSKERTQQLENLLKEEEKIIEKNLLEAKVNVQKIHFYFDYIILMMMLSYFLSFNIKFKKCKILEVCIKKFSFDLIFKKHPCNNFFQIL